MRQGSGDIMLILMAHVTLVSPVWTMYRKGRCPDVRKGATWRK